MTHRHDTAVLLDTVLQRLTSHGAEPVRTRFVYRSSDPFAVTVQFTLSDEVIVSWVFARQLLDDGLTSCAGEGDVSVWSDISGPARDAMYLLLRSDETSVALEAPRDVVAEWLLRTYQLLPRSAESAAVDWEQFSRQFFL
ncbi:SsgA family sporulation/cell division regulator [Streptomyces sp. NPDC005805]|uniref:SsgA family sporulation/cell division regulator n=1 Tax=Streptomyces sp. NPDC005805 TaxID=3157068 RepID=UPI0034079676